MGRTRLIAVMSTAKPRPRQALSSMDPYKRKHLQKEKSTEGDTSDDDRNNGGYQQISSSYRPNIEMLQKCEKISEQIIPQLKFQRLFGEILQDLKCDCKFQVGALSILHEAAEDRILSLFEDTNISSLLPKMAMIGPSDVFRGYSQRRKRSTPKRHLNVN